MRAFTESQTRWNLLQGDSVGIDLRQTVRECRADSSFDPCENGLRSVCWKAFLLLGPISHSSWPKKLKESRSAYSSLRDHFLRFIENPDELQSTADPLDDDDSSAWATLRQDETTRAEIHQDVTRCMQENFYFREPGTQQQLVDILFIYTKLNPDTGYRQGMHELLAPILWVLFQDALDPTTIEAGKDDEDLLLIETLDQKYIEHDAFNLFCAVMQTAKSFYEIGDTRDSSPIIKRCQHIQNEVLGSVDPELSAHLNTLNILPQIYILRWIRLLFGREFEFSDVLKMWDLLLAESLNSEVVDLTCVAMLIRLHWPLMAAEDYLTALKLLNSAATTSKLDARETVKDAIILTKNRNPATGAKLIGSYSGSQPKVKSTEHSPARAKNISTPSRASTPQQRSALSGSPARFVIPQKQLENIFSDVSGEIQRRTEGWSISRTVRGAVSEIRRNAAEYQSHSRQISTDILSEAPKSGTNEEIARLNEYIEAMESRQKALSKMLETALESLRLSHTKREGAEGDSEQDFNMSLAKIQFVTVYLSDPAIPIPQQDDQTRTEEPGPAIESPEILAKKQERLIAKPAEEVKEQKKSRPSLNDSSFSFMLGENRHRSSFVSSVSALPEQRRTSNAKPEPVQKPDKHKSKPLKTEDDGFTLNSLTGGPLD